MARPTQFPVFIQADTKEDLMREMLKNNLKHNTYFPYRDIQKDGKTWIAWFEADVETHASVIREFLNENN